MFAVCAAITNFQVHLLVLRKSLYFGLTTVVSFCWWRGSTTKFCKKKKFFVLDILVNLFAFKCPLHEFIHESIVCFYNNCVSYVLLNYWPVNVQITIIFPSNSLFIESGDLYQKYSLKSSVYFNIRSLSADIVLMPSCILKIVCPGRLWKNYSL